MALGAGPREGRFRTVVLPLGFGLFGLAVAAAAFAVAEAAKVPWSTFVGDQLVGLSYVVAGTIAWFRRYGRAAGTRRGRVALVSSGDSGV